MKKYIKWGIVIIVGAGLTTLGIHTFTPRENEDLAAVKDVAPTQKTEVSILMHKSSDLTC